MKPALSPRTRDACKTALAMTIAYGVALGMDWDKPMWAGFTVAFISIGGTGHSLSQGALRLLGTCAAVVAALVLLALFSQDRWLFMLFLSCWVCACTYKQTVASYSYFWSIAGSACIVISLEATGTSDQMFELAIARAQETGLGALVYSLVSVLVWPANSRPALCDTAVKLGEAHEKLCLAYFELLQGQRGAVDVSELLTQEQQLHTAFDQLLASALIDSYQVTEMREQWTALQSHRAALAELMRRGFSDHSNLAQLNAAEFEYSLAEFEDEIKRRFEQMDSMLAGKAPVHEPRPLQLAPGADVLGKLSPFENAAVAVTIDRLLQLDALTHSLFDSISQIQAFAEPTTGLNTPPAGSTATVLDIDMAATLTRVMATMWVAWLAHIYIDGIPGGIGFVLMACALSSPLALMPQIPVSQLLKPALVALLFSSTVYLFVMPHLTGYLQLGLVVFAATFAICYIFAAPQQVLGRALGLALFGSITEITNMQSYSFLHVVDTATMFMLVLALVAVTAQIPFSTRPDRAFERVLRRFFHSCAKLLDSNEPPASPALAWVARYQKAMYAQQLVSLPQKLQVWAAQLSTEALGNTDPSRLPTLLDDLQSVALRARELNQSREQELPPRLLSSLPDAVTRGRETLVETLRDLARDPATIDPQKLRAHLERAGSELEQALHTVIQTSERLDVSAADRENYFRVLGANRGLTGALVGCAENAAALDWPRLREERIA